MKKIILLVLFTLYSTASFPLFAQDLYIHIEGSSLKLPKLAIQFTAKNNVTQPQQIALFKKRLFATLQWSGSFQIESQTQDDAFLTLKTTIEKDSLHVTTMTKQGISIFDITTPFRPYHADQYAFMITKKLLSLLVHKTDILFSSVAYITKNRKEHKYALLISDPITNRAITPIHNYNIKILPRWERHGKYLLFAQIIDQKNQLFLLSSKTWLAKKVSLPSGVFSGASWKNQYSLFVTMAFHGNSSVSLLPLSSKKATKIINDNSINTMPRFNPRSNTLLFVSDRSGSVQIYQKNLKTNKIKRMTFQGTYNTDPAWSPSGDEFAYASRENGVFTIYIMSQNGLKQRQLTHTSHISAEQPTWSPNGQQIIYTGKKRGIQKLYAIYYNGTNNRRVTKSPSYIDEYNPSWIKLNLWHK